MPKRANTNAQSSNGRSSAANNDGRRKLRRLAAAPNISGTPVQSSTFSATTARQPTSSSETTAAQLYQNGVARQSVTSSTRATRQLTTSAPVAVGSDRLFLVPIKTGFLKCSPILPSRRDIIIACQTPSSNLPQNAIHFANFEALLPWIDSTEALNGQRFGSLNLNTDYPRIPSKKFKAHQAPKAKSKAANKKWSVQTVYKDQNKEWKVTFEGC
ncbi:unnamed protein product [Caenorhabditis brenneri]